MPTETVTFVTHETHDRNTRNGLKRLTEFVTEQGVKFQTWDPATANEVLKYEGQEVRASYYETQNGKFTNRNISSVEPTGSTGPPAGDPAGASAPTGAAAGEPASEQKPSAAPGLQQLTFPTDPRDERITRSFGINAALKALEISGGDVPAAETILKAAVGLASVPARYAWGE